MRFVHVKGIEIVDDASVPEGEVWIMCPMANGGKVRYMFNLLDHRMTQPADESFLVQLERRLVVLREQMSVDSTTMSVTQLDMILTEISDFKTGKDPRTLPHHAPR